MVTIFVVRYAVRNEMAMNINFRLPKIAHCMWVLRRRAVPKASSRAAIV